MSDWDPSRHAYYPNVWPWVAGLVIFNTALGFTVSTAVGALWGDTAQWAALVPLCVYSAWSGWAIVDWRWNRWRRETPKRPMGEWRWRP